MGHPPSATPQEYLLLRKQEQGECWVWTGKQSRDGYGFAGFRGKTRLVHRLAYEAFVGPIPEGLEIDHLCGTRNCWRPEHLEAVTRTKNLSRVVPDTHCPRGHERAVVGFVMNGTDRDGRPLRRCAACNRIGARRERATTT